MSLKAPSNWQQLITGTWHGLPSLFEPDGTHVGFNKVARVSESQDGRTRYWMQTDFDAIGPLRNRFEIGRFDFGVIDSDKDRIYTGPDFVGSGRPYGTLVDSEYFSPAWNTHLRTVNHVVPELDMQVYSSLLYEGVTLVCVFNGLYIVTAQGDETPAAQQRVSDWLERERREGKRPFVLPPKHQGRWTGELEVYDNEQELLGKKRGQHRLHTDQPDPGHHARENARRDRHRLRLRAQPGPQSSSVPRPGLVRQRHGVRPLSLQRAAPVRQGPAPGDPGRLGG